MYTAADLRKGLKVEIDGAPYAITEFSFNKPGKGQSIYSCKLRNLLTGTSTVKQYRSADKIDKAEMNERKLHYSYKEGDDFVFMDENYDQISLTADNLGDGRYFLGENMEVSVLFHRDRPIEVTLPTFVEKIIVHTEPGARGDTANNVLKPAKIESGFELQIPLFVNQGDLVRIDTRTGTYVDRVSKG